MTSGKYSLFFLLLSFAIPLFGQERSLNLDDFEDPGKSWQEASSIVVNPMNGSHDLAKGSGIFVNLPSKKRPGEDIRTKGEFSDFDLSFEYMMFPGSNSGVYMQGRYEIQLLDSWKKKIPTSGDNGGIYERWIEEEQRGYEGHPPRQNASLAPGLWQRMRISFRAPRFNSAGEKVENARILAIYLNDVLIQENVELSGPTRGSWGEEASKGPIRIQGDHGAVAFRDMKIVEFDTPDPEFESFSYEVYEGSFVDAPDFSTIEPVASGTISQITPAVSEVDGPFLIRYRGNVNIPVSGEYEWGVIVNGGGGILRIDGKDVVGPVEWGGNGKAMLEAGSHDVEFLYAKLYDWAGTAVGLAVQGPGIRWKSFYDENMNMGTSVDPILLHSPAIHRSFVDIEGGKRLIRAVSVGSQSGTNYTYDMDHGALVQAWHGDFMDATPMWHDRGDGSARPLGAVTMIDGDRLIFGRGSWSTDTAGTAFRTRGYRLEGPESPVFMYDIYGGQVEDGISVAAGGGSLERTVRTSGLPTGVRLAMAQGSEIVEVTEGMYRVDGKYFVHVPGGNDLKVDILPDGRQVLSAGVQPVMKYEIIF